jgi:hypothetical protein
VDRIGLVVPARADHVDGQLRAAAGQGTDGRGDDEVGHEPDGEGVRAAGGTSDTAAGSRLWGGQHGAQMMHVYPTSAVIR